MSNKQFGITAFSIAFGVTCFIWAILMSVIARDLRDRVIALEKEKSLLEQEITSLEWKQDQIDQMICIKE